jgi:hypothetical protein
MPLAVAVRLAVVVSAALAPTVLPAQTAAPDDAYRDPAARRLVARARERRGTLDRSISSYTTSMKERIGVGIRALRRDRMIYHRELALRITWRRDSVGHVAVLGARQGIPIALKGEQLPEDLVQDAGDYAFDPSSDRLAIGSDSGFIIHPLSDGSEAHYRFESGDSTLLSFPDGRRLRLYELRVLPRRSDAHLVAGALWIEGDGYGVVRLLTRLARAFDFEVDIERRPGTDATDTTGTADTAAARRGDGIPGFLKPLRADVRFFAIEYGLWDDRWWLPRLVSFDAVATVGGFAELPVRYELLYEDYEVTGDTGRAPERRPAPVPDDTARTQCRERFGEEVTCRCRQGRCFAFTVTVPSDTAALLASAALPASFRTTTDTMLSEQEISDLARQIRGLPGLPRRTAFRPPRWGLFRYNRVEALSLGARGELEAGAWWLDGLARIGIGDVVPNVELGIRREGTVARTRLAGYYRLAAADTANRPFGVLNSARALFFGKDDGDYFRTWGVELHGRPTITQPQTYAWRLYAERQRPVGKETDFSLPRVFDRDRRFRPNLVADSADQFGAAASLRGTRTFGDGGTTFGVELSLDGAIGTFDFLRAAMTARLTAPLPGPLTGGLEVAAGTSDGALPAQSRWYLGGPHTLRGYDGGVAAGAEFWRARAEVANDFPGARVALFADAGRASPRGTLSLRDALLGAGVGASFLDGLVRIDVGRATRAPTGWRVDFYLDGVL